MTYEEAKMQIQAIPEKIWDQLSEPDREAMEMAFSSLQAQEAQEWIPCKERLPEEDHWLGGSGLQFSDEVLISITHREDEDAWSDISQTIDGEWELELPRHCKITAWKPLPEPYMEEENE